MGDLQTLEDTKTQLKAAEAGCKEADARVTARKAAVGKARADRDKVAADVDAAKERLNVAKAEVGQVEALRGYLKIVAPFDGVVLKADRVPGEAVAAGKPLFVIADPRRLWLTLHVGQESAGQVAVGQPVRFRPDADTAEFSGTVAWVGTAADAVTRTVPIRVQVPNEDGRLRAATAVFLLKSNEWHTQGRAIFNLSPVQAIAHFREELEVVE